MYKEPISDIATCSDKTCVLLTLANYFDRWMSEAQWLERNKDKDPNDREAKAFADLRFTNSRKSKQNGRSKRLQGWAREGYLLFNNLHQRVANDWLRRGNFESELMTQMRINVDNYSSGSDDNGDEDEIFPANDLEGVVAPITATPLAVTGPRVPYDPYDHYKE
jgi:hypothetical protein